MNDLILHPNTAIKSPALKAAQDKLLKLAAAAENSKRGICIELTKIEADKLYEADGFKSLAEYGETIGLDKSLTHKLENAGRVYLSEKPATKALAANLDWSKAAMLASEDADKVEAAAAAGELKPDMTAKDVKTWKAAQAVKKGGKEKVVPNWHITGFAYTDKGKKPIEVTIGIDNPVNWAREYDSTALVASVKDNDGDTRYLATCMGGMFTYTAEKVKKVKAGKTPAKLSKEQVLRELARLQAMLDEDEDDEDGEDAGEGEEG